MGRVEWSRVEWSRVEPSSTLCFRTLVSLSRSVTVLFFSSLEQCRIRTHVPTFLTNSVEQFQYVRFPKFIRPYKARDTATWKAQWLVGEAAELSGPESLPLTKDIRRHMRTCAKAICRVRGGTGVGRRRSRAKRKARGRG